MTFMGPHRPCLILRWSFRSTVRVFLHEARNDQRQNTVPASLVVLFRTCPEARRKMGQTVEQELFGELGLQVRVGVHLNVDARRGTRLTRSRRENYQFSFAGDGRTGTGRPRATT